MHAMQTGMEALKQQYCDAAGDLCEFGDGWVWFVPNDVKDALLNIDGFAWIQDPPQLLLEAVIHALGADLGLHVKNTFEKAYRGGLAKYCMAANMPAHTWASATIEVCFDAGPTVRQLVSIGVDLPLICSTRNECLIEAAEGGSDVNGGALLDAVGLHVLRILE